MSIDSKINMNLSHFKSEYNPYFDIYLKLLDQNDNCFDSLNENHEVVNKFFDDIEDSKMTYTYAKDKWTISQILQHILDTERIFCYRALKIVREKQPRIISYDHELYAEDYKCHSKDLLMKDYNSNRKSSISLFKTFSKKDLNKSINQGRYKFKVGLIPFIFCGHELHHIEVIKSKYLTS